MVSARLTVLHIKSEGGIGLGCEIEITSLFLMMKMLSVNTEVSKVNWVFFIVHIRITIS